MLITAALTFLAAAGGAPAAKTPSFHDLSASDIDQKAQALSAYKGKVLLVVNTASACGNTPQYEGLEKLYQNNKAKPFAILGFPSNDFGGQEPGTETEIKKFCTLKYRVTFPMFGKVKTKGPEAHAVYKFLTAQHGEPKWNFAKYLVGKDGQVIRAFGAKVLPDDKELLAAIDAALAK